MTTCHDCADKHLARAEEAVCRQIIRDHVIGDLSGFTYQGTQELHQSRALDVGAGTSGAGARILKGWDYTGIDPNLKPDPENNIFGGNILRGPFMVANESYDLVLCKRVLCQMSDDDDVARAVENIHDLLRPGGYLLVCEPWWLERDRLCKLRKLPTPASGGKGVGRTPFREHFGFFLADVAVAPDYVLWTRYMQPMFYDEFLDYDDPHRELFPTFPPEAHKKFAFYRARLWRKTP